jgi:hypothetical protein
MAVAGGSHLLVECYWPDINDDKLLDATRRIESAIAALRGKGASVVYRGALLMPDDETVFCLFDGPEADVRTVSTRADLPFERVAPTRWVNAAPPRRT